MIRHLSRLAPLLSLFCCAAATAQLRWQDEFDTIDGWQAIAADGVRASLHSDEGASGRGMRIDFDFESGAGFCVIRKSVDLPLPANYRFSFRLRGEAPPNTLEFKLVDETNENVWWVRRGDFAFPTQWQAISQRARHFQFAWGPSGGKPLTRLGAIEFAIASSSGGKGSVWIDELRFEALPPPNSNPPAPLLRTTPAASPAAAQLSGDGALDWTPAIAQPSSLTLEFSDLREIGGVFLEWADSAPQIYSISGSDDGATWHELLRVEGSNGRRDYIPLAGAEVRQLRVDVPPQKEAHPLRKIGTLDPSLGESRNALMQSIAETAPLGWYPRPFVRQLQPWTVVGAQRDDKEALLDAGGAIEVDKRAFRIEPFLRSGGKLYTWADAESTPSLEDGYLPIPSVEWELPNGLHLKVTAVADGDAGASAVLLRYDIRNQASEERRGSLLLAARPFQVVPPWQTLNFEGGVSPVRSIRWQSPVLLVDEQPIALWSQPAAVGASSFLSGEIVEHLAAGHPLTCDSVSDALGLGSAAAQFDFVLAPGASQATYAAFPLHRETPAALYSSDARAAAGKFGDALQRSRTGWTERLNRVQISLPPSARELEQTFKTVQAHILINADGPGIQPGSRTYERSWIRDGAGSSTSMLYTGDAALVREYLDWFAPHQFENGKAPCVVDRRGADPVPEHDSTGQLIYTLLRYYRFTGDAALLERHYDRVVAGVGYIQSLRAQRMTDEYRDGPPEKRAMYGLVTESISHEGYSAKPMHSYWDSFWTLRGLKDAASIARILKHDDDASRFDALVADYRKCLLNSVALATRNKSIDFIPGCVELGDFDATSTATALYPCGEGPFLPEPLLRNTFQKYWQFFADRRDGRREWTDYTPYELRVINAMLRLDRRREALELIDFFMRDRLPNAWNQWPEVVHRDRLAPRFIGDLPHTWCGSEFINAFRSLFAYEREQDGALVIAAGVDPAWIAEAPGVRVENLPTEYGKLSYALHRGEAADEGRSPREFVLEFELTGKTPPGGIVFPAPIDQVIIAASLDGKALPVEHAEFLNLCASTRGTLAISVSPAR